MEKTVNRNAFQGVGNILAFNWHFYLALVIALGLFSFAGRYYFTDFFLAMQLLLVFSTVLSLAVSFYIYDLSGFYKMDWLHSSLGTGKTIANINAGFDETSALLQARFENTTLMVYDFYNPQKHTEVSIKRARKRYGSYPGTISVDTRSLPCIDAKIDAVFLIFAAHEIRDAQERVAFFKELNRILADDGKIILIEHLRDFANFTAFSIGFLHFFSRKSWISTIENSGLKIESETKLTPFTSLFTITKNGNAP